MFRFAIFFTLICATACTPKDSKLNTSSVLNVQLVNEPVSLDPSLVEDGVAFQVINAVSNGLVGYDGAGVLQKELAEDYAVSEDGKTYEFTLRKDALWSDGQPLRARDFVLALRRTLSPKTTSKLAPLYYAIRGAQAYHRGEGDRGTVPEVAKNSPVPSLSESLGVSEQGGKLVIELERRVPYFIQVLALPPAFPLREDVLKSHAGFWPERAPVTGPYQIASHTLGEKIVLTRNPQFWGKAAVISTVNLWIVPDETTAMHLFEKGKLDILSRISSLDFPRLKKAGHVHTDPFLATYYLSFNCRKPPFNDRNWRRAVAGAIRRDEITMVLNGGELPALSWIPPGLEGYVPYESPVPLFASAVDWAKPRAAQVGAIVASFDSGSRNARVMEKVQQDLKQNLGLRVNLVHYDWRTYVKTIQSDTPPLFRFGWLAPFGDPISHLEVFKTGNLNNYSGCSVPAYDAAVEEIEKMNPGKERELRIKQAEVILTQNEAVVVPLFHYVQNTGVSERVKGFRINPFGIIPFHELTLSQ
jgi:oligopeptide transport system substrate-binding protein